MDAVHNFRLIFQNMHENARSRGLCFVCGFHKNAKCTCVHCRGVCLSMHLFLFFSLVFSLSLSFSRDSLQSWEDRRLRGKVKVGEAGLVPTAGADLRPPLDTTDEAGT